jgi:hypothetical protein
MGVIMTSNGAKHVVLRARNLECPTPAKYGYVTRKDAKGALRQLVASGKVVAFESKRLRAYSCACGLFHVGNDFRGASRDRFDAHEAVGCSVKRCEWPGDNTVTVGGREVLLCDHHKIELDARVAEKKAAA